jgi:endonuclease/exonuclease/phosphatase (EEP) superfamily protein YafD
LHCETGELGPNSYFALHRLRVRAREVNVLQVDLVAGPTKSRRAPLAQMAELAARTGGNLIIAGDFNTPRESVHLEPLRAQFRHAFEAAGHGLAETWPSFAPALSLDQVWIGRQWQPSRCVNGWTWLSDHQLVVVDLAPR